MKKKEKAIIALYGPEDTGKTTTLRKLALEFLDSPEVEEDIQVGFLYYKENEKKPTKIVVSTVEDPRVNADFYTGLTAKPLILVTTTRTKDQTGEINVVAELVKEEGTDLKKKIREQAKIDNKLTPEIEKLISSIANDPIANGETAPLRLFLLRLLKSEVVGDIQIAFRYKGKKMVISTAGDGVDVVNESTGLFQKVEGDILVTATRSERSNSHKRLKQYKEDTIEIGKDAIWIHSSGALLSGKHQKYQTLIDEGLAKTIQSIIDQIITDWKKE